MQFRYLVVTVTWIAMVTATLEPDSHGNWSNEKELLKHSYVQEVLLDGNTKEEAKDTENTSSNQYVNVSNSSQTVDFNNAGNEEALSARFINRNEENYQANEPQQQFFKQVVQPYVLLLKNKSIPERILSELLNNVSRSTRTSQSATNETVIVEYIPSQEIVVQNSSTSVNYSTQKNNSDDLGQVIPKENQDRETVKEFGQRIRSSTLSRQGNTEDLEQFRPKQPVEVSSTFEDHQKQYRKSFHSYRKLNESDSEFNICSKDRFPFAMSKIARNVNQEGIDDFTDVPFVTRDISSTSTSAVPVSLGKFSGPIVVPDFPHQQKYFHTTTPKYSKINEVIKSSPALSEASKSKMPENDYLAVSAVVLRPLQVGVSLMNAGQDLNSVNDQGPLTKEYLQDEAATPKVTEIDNKSLIQGNAPNLGNSSFQDDQVSQQEQIFEVVSSGSPTQSVEIQKSVEIFHTAPVQEIHYPVEFIPNVQQPIIKQHLQEDYRKLPRDQFNDQRPDKANIYRSNEILDETVSSNGQEHSRYEYENENENDIIYSATNGQVDPSLAVAPHPVETRTIFGAKEQVEPKFQRIPEGSIKQNDYALPKGSSVIITQQPPRKIGGLPTSANLENFQGPQEMSQILLTKITNESPAEFRHLISTSQSYPAEKIVHIPRPVDIEKKVPFPMEKAAEKQILIPEPFPLHIPVDRVVEKQIGIPYPVPAEKVIEKRIPFTIQRFIIPLPFHFRAPQPVPFPAEKIIEQPAPLSGSVEKIVEKVVRLPASLETEKNSPYSLESANFVKSGSVYNVQSDGNYQQATKHNFRAPLGPMNEQSYYNSTQFYRPGNLALINPPFRQPLVHTLPKKFGLHGIQYPHSMTYSVNNGKLVTYGRTLNKDKIKDEYMNPLSWKLQASSEIQSKPLYSTPDIQATFRKTRQEVGNIGSFRQSKMEYGFKPPMVPSVQYDEQTATKVE